jgi:hypothetical protein
MVGDAGFAPAIFCVWNSCSDWTELIPVGPSARTLTMISGFAGLRPIWLDDGGEKWRDRPVLPRLFPARQAGASASLASATLVRWPGIAPGSPASQAGAPLPGPRT